MPERSPESRGESEARERHVEEEKAERREKELKYARMIDQYHRMFLKERNLIRLYTAKDERVQELTWKRDELHKKIEALGMDLGKNKIDVLGDLLRREGNLGEYGVPQYGVISREDLADFFTFGSFDVDSLTGQFKRGSEAVATQERHDRDLFLQDEDEEIEVREFNVPNVGKTEHQMGLRPGELGVVFGAKYTVDILQQAADLFPAETIEQWRRSALAAKEFGGTVFEVTSGAYHETTTLIGVAVPSERIEEFAYFLKNNLDRFDVRKEALDPEIVDYDRRKIIEMFQSALESINRNNLINPKDADNAMQRYLEMRHYRLGEPKPPKKSKKKKKKKRQSRFDDEFEDYPVRRGKNRKGKRR